MELLAAADGLFAADRDWASIPAVKVLGAVVGILLLIAALRAMWGKR